MIAALKNKYPFLENIIALLVVIFSSVVYALAMNLFLIPGHIYSGGVMGFAQLITYFLNHYTSWQNVLLPGQINFILNIPIIILSLVKLGKRFTFLTLLVVFGISMASSIIPVTEVSTNPLLNGVIGGVLAGTAIGVAVWQGLSAGGTDIISVVIFRATGVNVGSITLVINLIIIFFVGQIYTWEFALYTLISMYTSAKVINYIHTNEHRLTVFIVTDNPDEVTKAIFKRIRRGVTVLEGYGGYSKKTNYTLMIVVNRYELYDLQTTVMSADAHVFMNVIESSKVVGNFLSEQQQKKRFKELELQNKLATK